ncbi:MAG: beta strand repeat-containing protein [Thermoplasmata archaeon]
MEEDPSTTRNRAVGLALFVCLIMVGGAALSSVSAQAASATASGASSGASSVGPQPVISTVISVGQTYTVSVAGPSVAFGSNSAPTAYDSGSNQLSTTSSGSGDAGTIGTSSVSPAIQVHPDVSLAASISPSPGTIDVGESSTLTLSISGGVSPYTWSFAENGSSTNISGAWPTYLFSPTGSGVYTFYLNVTDSASNVVDATATLTVNSALAAPAAPTPASTKLDFNQALTVSGTLSSTGTSPYQYEWLYSTGASYVKATVCATPSGSGASPGPVTCSVAASTLVAGAHYAFELLVNDSAPTPESQTSPPSSTVAVSSTLTAPGAPTVTATKLDANQALTVTRAIQSTGTPSYSWQWLVKIGAASYVSATQCAVNSGSGAIGGATETCNVAASTLTGGNTYTFELKVTDSASTAETLTSSASSPVTVAPALTAPSAPNPSATAPPASTILTVTGMIPSSGTSTYSWVWLVSIGGGSYSVASQCGASASGSGATGPATETCTIPGGTLAAGTNYNFELQVTDSATSPETQTSAASSTVSTTSALTADFPTPTAQTLDSGQSITLTANPTGGTGPYTDTWYATTVSATSTLACTSSNWGSSVAVGSSYSPSPTVNSWYCYSVTDTEPVTATSAAAAVTVNPALTAPAAPTPGATKLDLNQALAVTATIPSTGTPSYSWQWLLSINGGGYADTTQCAVNSGTGATGGTLETCNIAASGLVTGDSYTFVLQVTDSASIPETQTSPASLVVSVSATLTAPAAPTVSATKLDLDQALTVSRAIQSTGTPTYSWQWLIKINSGSYASATQCAVSSGSGALGGATETCLIAGGTLTSGSSYAFELQVVDSASTAETVTSGGSSTVTVSAALTSAGSPSPASVSIDSGQTVTLSTGTVTGGSSPYTYAWYSTTSATVAAEACIAANWGSSVAAGSTYTPSPTLITWYCYTVTDSATTTETASSSATSLVTVNPVLSAGSTTPSSPGMDTGQSITLTAHPAGGTTAYSYHWYSGTGSGACAGTALGTSSTQSTGALTTGTYYYCYVVTDSSQAIGGHESASSAWDTVTVNPALTSAGSPSPPSPSIDSGQSVTLTTGTVTGGTTPYGYTWYSTTSATVAAEVCTAANWGTSVATDSPYTVSPTLATWYCYTVTDSAAVTETVSSTSPSLVTVNPALSAASPTPSSPGMDSTQSITLSANPSGGTTPYSFQWYVGTGSGACTGTALGAISTQSTGALTTGTYYFCYSVTDSSQAIGGTETATSPWDAVQVNAAPSITSPLTSTLVMDRGQSYAYSVVATGGTGALSYAWTTVGLTVVSGCLSTSTTCTVSGSAAGYTVTVTIGDQSQGTGGSYPSSASALTVEAANPSVSISPASATIDPGQTILLTATPAGGTGSWSYQWYSNAGCTSAIGGATSATYTALGSASTTTYCFVATDTGTTVGASPTEIASATDVVTVEVANPSVAISPSSATIDPGQSILLSATPSGGTGTWSYQWYSNAGCTAAIGGATSATYTALGSAGTATYCVKVTDAGTTSPASPMETASATDVVTVAASNPSVSISPAPAKIDPGQSILLTATPSGGTGTWSYQWYSNAGCTVAIGGATSVTYTALGSAGTTTYCIKVSDTGTTGPAAPTETATATDVVTVEAANPSVSILPSPAKIDPGQTILLSATTAGGTGTWTYQWYSNAGCTTSIGGATSASYTALGSTGTVTYCIKVTDTGTTSPAAPTETASATDVVTVEASNPTVSISPSVATIDPAQTILLTAAPVGGTGTWTYQWYSNAGCTVSIGGATSVTYTALGSSGTTTYCVKVTDSGTTSPAAPTETAAATDVVTVEASNPSVTISPSSAIIDPGQNILLTASPAGGTGTWSYQWYSNAGCTTSIGGATSATYTVLGSAGSTTYCIKVTDTGTTSPAAPTETASATDVVTVEPSNPSTTIAPSSATLDPGQSILLTASPVGGTGTWSYQWYSNAGCTTSIGGATSATYTALGSAGTATYCFVATDTGTTVGANPTETASATDVVTVEGANPSVSISPSPVKIDPGQSILLTATPAGGTGTWSYQWYSNAGCTAAIGGATSATYTALASAGSSTYCIKVTDTGTTSPATPTESASSTDAVTVEAADPSVSISPSPAKIDPSQSILLTASPSGGTGTWGYQWYSNAGCSVAIGGATSATYTALGSASTTTYCVKVTDTGTTSPSAPTETASATDVVTVEASNPSTSIAPSAATIDPGQSILLTAAPAGGTGTWTYQWYSNSGCTTSIGGATSATYTALGSGGTATYCFVATDTGTTVGASPTATASATDVVTVEVSNPSVSISPSAATIDPGQSILLTASPSGGTGTWAYQWYSNVGCTAAIGGATSATYTALGSASTTTYCVKVTDTGTTSPATPTETASATDIVTVEASNPSVSIAPSPAKIDPGQSILLTASPTGGTGTWGYQWFSNAGCTAAIGGATSATYNAPGSSGTTTYCVKITDTGTTAPAAPTETASATVVVTVEAANPSVSIAPSPAKIDPGQSILLTASPAGGTGTWSYQWYSNVGCTAAIGGATSLTFTALGSSSTTTYCFVATDTGTTVGAGPAETATATDAVTVEASNPSVTISPPAATIDPGQSILLTASPAGGTGTWSYQWYSNAGCTVAIGAATSATYAALGSASTATYCVKVTDTGTTSPATPTEIASATDVVTVEVSNPSVTISPSSASMDPGQSILLTAAPAGGTGTWSYQWYSNIGCTAAIGGATSAVFNAPGSAGTTPYCVKVTDTGTTSPATPTESATATDVVTVEGANPSVFISPSSATIDPGQTILLTATPAGGTGTWSYQWYSNAGCTVPIGGATSATFTALGSSGTTTYCVKVTDTGTTSPATPTETAAANDLVTEEAANPTVTISPTSPAIDANQNIVLTAVPVGGTGSWSYQWYSNVGCTAPISGATSVTYTALGSDAATTYCVSVTDTGTTSPASPTETASATDTVTVNPALVPGSSSPVSPTIDSGNSIALSTSGVTGGTGGLSYQWYSSNTNPGSGSCASGSSIGGATATSYTTPSLTSDAWYCYTVMDSAQSPSTQGSTWDLVTVITGLAPPAKPTVSATALDVDQALTVTDAIPTTGTPPYSWQWLLQVNGAGPYVNATECAVANGTGIGPGLGVTCSILADLLTPGDSYAFELNVTDSAATPETSTSHASDSVEVSSELTAPSAPTPGATALDRDQLLSVTGTIPTTGTSTYSWQWLVSVNGASYTDATQCTTNSGTGASDGVSEMCSIPANTLTAGSTYVFELMVTDSATSAEAQASPGSATVTVDSALTAPSAPTSSATKLDVDQSLTVTGTIPTTGTSTDTWEWMVSINSGPFVPAFQCVLNGGNGAIGGVTETCLVAAGTLTVDSTYAFELMVTDSATSAETQTSAASSTVVVRSALTADGAPTVSATTLDADQMLTVSGTIPSTGSPTYAWQWLVSVNHGSFSAATFCVMNSGGGAAGGATETCTILGGILLPGDTYSFDLQVRDTATTPETQLSMNSATVTVNSVLAAPTEPTVSATALDVDQVLSVAGTIPSSGTSTFSWQWLVSVNGAAYAPATQCTVSSGTAAVDGAPKTCSVGASALTVADTYSFELEVTDSASAPEVAVSAASATVGVSSALTATAAPSPSAANLDVDQALTVAASSPSTGTPSYSWQWLVSVNAGSYEDATQCAVNSGAGASGGAAETCSIASGTLVAGDSYSWELEVTDSASAPQVTNSTASSTVTVSSALTVPTAPTPSATNLYASESLTVNGQVPSTGTPSYSWQWLISVNGGSFANAMSCAVNTGSGGSAGATETCSIASGTLTSGNSYAFELQVTDSATTSETTRSAPSPAVMVRTLVMALSLAQGPQGATFTLTGSGFTPSSVATVSFNSALQVPTGCTNGTFSSTSITTDSSGRFTCTFKVPSDPAGSYSVAGTDATTNAVTTAMMFRITTPSITVSPPQAAVGATVTVSGTGFSVSAFLTSLVFDSQQILSCATGSLMTNGTGAFSCSFVVPSGTSGTTVTATDPGGQAASGTFTTKIAPTMTSSSFPWIWLFVAVAIAALAVAALFAVRRRRAGAPSAAPEWTESTTAVPSAEGGSPWQESPPVDAVSAVALSTSAAGAGAAATPASEAPGTYGVPLTPLEPAAPVSESFPPSAIEAEPPPPTSPDPLAAALAAVPVSENEYPTEPAPVTPPVTDPGSVAESKFDIDSIFAELDAISGDILKPPVKKPGEPKPSGEPEERTEDDPGQ